MFLILTHFPFFTLTQMYINLLLIKINVFELSSLFYSRVFNTKYHSYLHI